MLTLGDVLAVVALVFGTAFALSALSFSTGFAFPIASERAARRAEARTVASLFAGLGITVPVVFLGAVLANLPNPLAKSLGVTLLAAYVLLLAYGTGVVSWLMAGRIQSACPGMGRHTSLAMASLGVAVAMILPFVGWFLIGPIVSLVGFGAWATSRKARISAPPVVEDTLG